MILMYVRLNHVYGFDDFELNLTYPRKLNVSVLGLEALAGRERFRYKKALILMGANATGKTSLGKALLKIFSSIQESNEAILRDLDGTRHPAEFQVDFVNAIPLKSAKWILMRWWYSGYRTEQMRSAAASKG